jgi:hypothetical protein
VRWSSIHTASLLTNENKDVLFSQARLQANNNIYQSSIVQTNNNNYETTDIYETPLIQPTRPVKTQSSTSNPMRYLSIYLTYLPIYLSMYLTLYVSISLCIYRARWSVHMKPAYRRLIVPDLLLGMYLCVYLSMCLSMCLSIYLSI